MTEQLGPHRHRLLLADAGLRPELGRLGQRREQHALDEHAAFMDGLVDDGFVILGGPIGDGERVLLVVEATDERAIKTRLGEDPWAWGCSGSMRFNPGRSGSTMGADFDDLALTAVAVLR